MPSLSSPIATATPAAPHVLEAALLTARHELETQIDALLSPSNVRPSAALSALRPRLAAAPWDQPPAPAFENIPDSLWGVYADWLLTVPGQISDEQEAHAIALHLAQRIDEIAGWMERNLGSPAVRAAADALLRMPAPALSAFPPELRLPVQKARARALLRLQGRKLNGSELTPKPRTGRPLRIGVVQRDFCARSETFATLAWITQLDRQRCEVYLFAFEGDYSSCETHCRDQAAGFQVLPDVLSAQVEVMKAENLDVLIFADDLSSHAPREALLALQRIAPLQAVTSSTAASSALPSIDLYLTGEYDAGADLAGQLTERLALLPETSRSYDFTPDRSESIPLKREDFNLPAAATLPLLVSMAPAEFVSHAELARWARILAAQPEAHLLIIPAKTALSPHAVREQAKPVFASAKISLNRLHLFDQPIVSVSGLQAALSLADLAFDLPGAATALALENGLPVIARTHSESAAILRSAGLSNSVAQDDAAVAEKIRHLFSDLGARMQARDQVQSAYALLPRFADSYAIAADYCALIETAFDELAAKGPRLFTKNREPLKAAKLHSLLPQALQAEGRDLIANDRPDRAVPCLLSALQRAGENASLWFDLARAYRGAGQAHTALETLEASLRLDDRNAEGWIMLCELAADVGSLELARESLDLASALNPDDERISALRTRLSA